MRAHALKVRTEPFAEGSTAHFRATGDKIMTTFQLSFGLDNASFADDPQTEIARILRTVADEIDSQRRTILDVGCIIRDSNGNHVGGCMVTVK